MLEELLKDSLELEEDELGLVLDDSVLELGLLVKPEDSVLEVELLVLVLGVGVTVAELVVEPPGSTVKVAIQLHALLT